MASEEGVRSPEPESKPFDPARVSGVFGGFLLILGSRLAWLHSPLRGTVPVGLAIWAIPLGLVAALAAWRGLRSLLLLSGVLALGLLLLTVLRLATADTRLWGLADDNAQHTAIVHFARADLVWNLGTDPQVIGEIPTLGVTERLFAAVYFTARGWWFCLVGSLLIVMGCFRAAPLPSLRLGALLATLVVGGAVLSLATPLSGERLAAQGDRLMAYGQFRDAIDAYEAAQKRSPQLLASDVLWARMGEACYRLNLVADERARFYVAEQHASFLDFDAAIGEYLPLAEKASEPLRSLARARLAWAYARRGVLLYSKLQSAASAVTSWEKALEFDPKQVQAEFFLSRGYFDVGLYDQSVAMGQRVLGVVNDSSVKADALCNIGDSLTKLHLFQPARAAYDQSFLLDYDMNYRYFRSDGGT
jgi:tetratricopeptide (TPR) repeat protein